MRAEVPTAIEDNLIFQLLRLNNDLPLILKQNFHFFKTPAALSRKTNGCLFVSHCEPQCAVYSEMAGWYQISFLEPFFNELNRKNEKLILEIISSWAVTAFTYWLKNPYDVDIDCLNLLIMKTLQLLG